MKIAIIGCGIVGLTAARLLSPHVTQIVLFRSPLIKAASQVAAGLVHPFVGMRANYAANGWEALKAAKEMIRTVCGEDTPLVQIGVFRPAVTTEMTVYFKKAADEHSNRVVWIDNFRIGKKAFGGILIPDGFAISSKKYMSKLLFVPKNSQIIEQHITSISELRGFDRVLITAGAGTRELAPQLNIRINKGQLLQYKMDEAHQCTSPYALSGRAYAVFEKDSAGHKQCTIGSTYEHFPTHDEVDIDEAKKIILPKVEEFLPAFEEGAQLIKGEAAYRAATPDSKPLIQRITPGVWTIAGLGSKGFLYHAYLPQLLLQPFLEDRPLS